MSQRVSEFVSRKRIIKGENRSTRNWRAAKGLSTVILASWQQFEANELVCGGPIIAPKVMAHHRSLENETLLNIFLK